MIQLGIALLSIAASLAHAGDFSSSAKGTTSAAFLKLGAGARAAAMGEAYCAVADDPSALYWNPAGLALIHGGAATFMHAPYVESSYYDYAAYAQNIPSLGTLSLGGQFFSMGKITQTDVTGAEIGSFTPQDMAISLGYARKIHSISLGLSGKFIRSTILKTAQTQTLDLGLLSPELWQGRLRLAFVANNLGGQLKFDREGADLPTTLRAGSLMRLSKSFSVALDGIFPKDNSPYVAFGSEWRIPLSKAFTGSLRAGLNTRTLQDLGFTIPSMGVGLLVGGVSMDYAFVALGALGHTHRFSLSLRWGQESSAMDSLALKPSHELEKESGKSLPEQTHYARHQVLFQYQNKEAKNVELLGDFNNWDPEPMMQREDGLWIVIKQMSEGLYHYTYRVDGREILDPWNKQSTLNTHKSKIGASILLLGANLKAEQ